MTKEEVKNILADALWEAMKVSKKNCDAYISWNPSQKENRERDLMIEQAGMSAVYYAALDQLNKRGA